MFKTLYKPFLKNGESRSSSVSASRTMCFISSGLMDGASTPGQLQMRKSGNGLPLEQVVHALVMWNGALSPSVRS
jgi:hypothetical protein